MGMTEAERKERRDSNERLAKSMGTRMTGYLAAFAASRCQKKLKRLEHQLQVEKGERQKLLQQLCQAKREAVPNRSS